MLRVGVDCERISRFRKLPYRKNQNFYRKIFTLREIEYCISCRDPYPRFAVRFAAKEATIKALNGIARPFYTDIEVQKNRQKQPKVHIDRNRFKGVARVSVSLSLTHSGSYAIAFVVAADDKKGVKQSRKILRKGVTYVKKIGKKFNAS